MVSCSLGPELAHFNNTIKQTCKTEDNFLLSHALLCSLIHAHCLFCSGAAIPAARFSKAQPGPADPVQNQAVIQTPKQKAQHQLSHPGLKVQSQATLQPAPHALPLCFKVLKCCFLFFPPGFTCTDLTCIHKDAKWVGGHRKKLTFYLCHFYLYTVTQNNFCI